MKQKQLSIFENIGEKISYYIIQNSLVSQNDYTVITICMQTNAPAMQ